jgi:hypothetical protein
MLAKIFARPLLAFDGVLYILRSQHLQTTSCLKHSRRCYNFPTLSKSRAKDIELTLT